MSSIHYKQAIVILFGSEQFNPWNILHKYLYPSYIPFDPKPNKVRIKSECIRKNGICVNINYMESASERIHWNPSLFTHSDAVLLFYDRSSRSDFDSLPEKIQFIRENAKKNPIILLIATFNDNSDYAVSTQTAKEFVERENWQKLCEIPI